MMKMIVTSVFVQVSEESDLGDCLVARGFKGFDLNYGSVNFGPVRADFKKSVQNSTLHKRSAIDMGIASPNLGLYGQMNAADNPADLHNGSKGCYDIGVKKQGMPFDQWIERFADWLRIQGFMK
jgi:hypothetical protein